MTQSVETTLPDAGRLGQWLRETLDIDGLPGISPVQGGASNLIYRIDVGGRRFALRRPPAVANDASSNNIVREMTLLRALAKTPVRHTRLVAGCEDREVIGVPFELLEWNTGFTGKAPLPAFVAGDASQRRAMAFELVDALASLAAVDWRAVGLEAFGKPEGFLERQVERWSTQLARYRTRDIAGLDDLAAWLAANTPRMQRACLMHGDYQFINVMYEATPPVRLSAIVDWESATIGDPLLDLGWMLAGWQEPGEEPSHASYIDWTGMPLRAEIAARYAAATGLSTDHLPYYMALAMFKLAVIMEGAYSRFKAGGSTLQVHADMEAGVPAMVRRGLRFAALS